MASFIERYNKLKDTNKTGNFLDRFKNIQNKIAPISEFQKLETRFKPQTSSFLDKYKKVKEQDEPSFISKVGSFFNPLEKTQVRPPLALDSEEIYGGKFIGGVTNIASRIMEDLVSGGVQGINTVRKAQDKDPVKLPVPIKYERLRGLGEPEVITTDTPQAFGGESFMNRADELDKERPDKPFLNLLQASTEEIFIPILDSVDIFGVGELGVRGLRTLATKKSTRDALKKIGVTAFGDISERGIREGYLESLNKVKKDLKKNKITEQVAKERTNEIGNAFNSITSDKFRFGNLGDKIGRWGEELTKNRGVRESLDQLRDAPLGLSVKAVDEVPQNLFSGQVKGVNPDVRFASPKREVAEKYAKINKGVTGESEIVDIPSKNLKFKTVPQAKMQDALEDVSIRSSFDGIRFKDNNSGEDVFAIFKPSEEAPVRETVKPEFTGKQIADEVVEMGSDQGGISDFTANIIKKEDYITEQIPIQRLRELDPDLDEYLKSGEIREFEGEPFAMNPIVSSGGEVIDGYNKIAQALADGEDSISVLRGTPKTRKKTIPIRGADGKFQGSISLADDTIETAPEGFKKLDDKTIIADDVAEDLNEGKEVKNLVAVHNLTYDNLLEVEKAGGLPNPSLAIFRAGDEYDSFGSISLIGDVKMIDPQASESRVFAGDIYSPRVDVVDYPDFKGIFAPEFEQLRKDLDAADIYYQDWGDISMLPKERVINKLQQLDGVDEQEAIKIAEDIWGEPKVLLKKDEPTGELASLIDEEPSVRKMFDEAEDFNDLSLVLENEVDIYSTLERRAEDAGFGDTYDYVRSLTDDFADELPATAENLALKSRKTNASRGVDIRGGEKGFGATAPNRVFGFDELRNVQDIREQAVRSLRSPNSVDDIAEEFSKKEDELNKQIINILNLDDEFGIQTKIDNFVGDVLKGENINEGAKIFLGVDKLSFTQVDDIKRLVKDTYTDVPAGYFEAKRLDAVKLSDFKGALIPDDGAAAVAELKDILQRNGIDNIYTYTTSTEKANIIKKNFKEHHFAVTPVPILEEDEEGNISIDPLKSAMASIGVGFAVGSMKSINKNVVKNADNLPRHMQEEAMALEMRADILSDSPLNNKANRFLVDKEGRVRELGDVKTSKLSRRMEDMMAEANVEDPTEFSEQVEQFFKDKETLNSAIKEFNRKATEYLKADKQNQALETFSDPKKVAKEALKTTKRISGIAEDGVKTAAKNLEEVKPIKNTPKKAAIYSVKNPNVPLTLPDETMARRQQLYWQDQFNRLELAQKTISKKKGLPLSDELDAYLQQEMYHGGASDRIRIFRDKLQKKDGGLLIKMREDGINVDEMGEYLHAKHAKARNKRVAEINDKIPDGGSGLTNAEAEKILAKYANKASKFDAYAKDLRKEVIDARLKILQEEHLMTPEAINTIAKTFEDGTYVPLKLAEKPNISLRGGKGFDVRGKDIKNLTGSTNAKRNNPIIQAITDYEDTVIKAEKNKVGRTLKKLVENNPHITNQQGKKIWSITKQKGEPVYNEFGEIMDYKPINKSGLYKLADNVMEVRDRGEIYHIKLEDEALAIAMKNLGTERGVKYLGGVTNYLRNVITNYNPVFWVTNFERDYQTALIRITGKLGEKAATEVGANTPKAIRAVWKSVRDKTGKIGNDGIDWVKEYDELRATGGTTGWFDYKTVAEKQDEIIKIINRATGKTFKDKTMRTIDGIAEYVSNINESIESGVRLAAYVSAKKRGLSKKRAASLAKNLTVNFNKKGLYGAKLNSWFMFSNAGIQGGANVFDSLKSKKVRRVVMGITAASFGVAYSNHQINSDGYEKISDFEKNTNLIFMLPAGADAPDIDPKIGSVEKVEGTEDRYLKIKLPYGYNVFKVLGDVSYEMMVNAGNIGDNLKRMVFAMDESFNPLSSGSALQLVSPTITDPAVQLLENKNYFGGKIRPDQPQYGKEKKKSDLYFSTVRKPSKMFTDWLSDVTGGNEVKEGLVEISPENVDHMIDFIGGGVSRFLADVVDSGANLVKGDLPELENAPFINKVIGEVYEEAEKFQVYDLLDKSAKRFLNDQEVDKLKRFSQEAYEEGQFDAKEANRIINTYVKYQSDLHAGEIYEQITKQDALKDNDLKREIFNSYIEENNLQSKKTEVFESLVNVSKKAAEKTTEDGKGFLQTLIDGGRGLFIDPENVWKAITSEEKIGRVKGNLVELKRFYGIDFYEEGGSSEKKKEMMEEQGLNWDQNDEYNLEHITPVKAGGDTSDENLMIVPNAEHESYTPVDIAAAAAVQTGNMTRKEVEDLMIRLKVQKSITPDQAYEEIRSKAK